MRTVLQALQDLLEPRHLQRGALELRERDPGSTCAPTKLDRKGQATVLRFEPWPHGADTEIPINRWLFPLFDVKRSKPPICRSCDYIIFYSPPDFDRRLFVFLCELKSGSPKGSRDQLRNGKLLADYILAVTRLHGGVHDWPEEISFRGIVFAGKAMGTRGATRAPARADYIEDERFQGDLRVTTQRPGKSYALDFFCA